MTLAYSSVRCKLFGGLTHSAVAKIYQRVQVELVNNRKLGKRIEKALTKLSSVNG